MTLFEAIEANNTEEVKRFLDEGVDPNEYEDEYSNALAMAIFSKSNDTIIRLLYPKTDLTATDGDERTVYDIIETDHLRSLFAELKFGNPLSQEDGITNYFRSAMTYDLLPNLAYYLRQKDFDLNLRDSDGNTALHIAAMNDIEEAIRLLLQRGIDYTIKNNEGHTYEDYLSPELHESVTRLETENLFSKTPVFYIRTEDKYILNEDVCFTEIKSLGSGTFGKVNLVINNIDHKVYALKSFYNIKDYHHEMFFIKRLSSAPNCHPQIACYYNDFITVSWENGTGLFLMEYVDGVTIEHYKFFNYDELRKILIDLLVLLKELDILGIRHNDVSVRNVMILPGGKIKLLDFGVACDASISYDPDDDYTFGCDEFYPTHRQEIIKMIEEVVTEFRRKFMPKGGESASEVINRDDFLRRLRIFRHDVDRKMNYQIELQELIDFLL